MSEGEEERFLLRGGEVCGRSQEGRGLKVCLNLLGLRG